MQNKKQKQSLATRFEAYKSAPTDKVWNNIEAQLDEDKRKRGLLWWWSANAAILLLTVGTFFYMRTGANVIAAESKTQLTVLQQDEKKPEKLQSTSSTVENTHQVTETNTSENNTNGETNQNEVETNEQINSNHSSLSPVGNTDIRTAPSPAIFGGDTDIHRSAKPNVLHITGEGNADKEDKREKTQIDRVDPLSTRSSALLPTPEVTQLASTIDYSYFKQENRWEIGLRMGQFYTANRKFPSVPPDTPPDGSGGSTTSGGNNTFSLNENDQTLALGITQYENRKYGELEVFAQRRFMNRLYVSLGLSASYTKRSYTHILKDTYTSAIKVTQVNRQYWNIGAPIHIKYSLLRRGAFDLGLGAGLISEYRILKEFPDQETLNALNAPAKNGFMFSGQPYLFGSYSLRNTTLFIEAGYRANLSDQTERNAPARANYLVGNIGVSWKLR